MLEPITEGDLEQFSNEHRGGPVVKLNLLRFRPDRGRHRYQQGIDAARSLPAAASDVQWIYYGLAHRSLESDRQPDWDAIVLVCYASRSAFVEAMRAPAYQLIRHLREDAIRDSVLQPTTSLLQ